MSDYSGTTLVILEQLARRPATAQQLAQVLERNQTTIATILLRLYGYGHVSRERIQDGTIVTNPALGFERPRLVYLYRPTDKGLQRMKILRGRFEGQRKRGR